jgi:hypothetical protein
MQDDRTDTQQKLAEQKYAEWKHAGVDGVGGCGSG